VDWGQSFLLCPGLYLEYGGEGRMACGFGLDRVAAMDDFLFGMLLISLRETLCATHSCQVRGVRHAMLARKGRDDRAHYFVVFFWS